MPIYYVYFLLSLQGKNIGFERKQKTTDLYIFEGLDSDLTVSR